MKYGADVNMENDDNKRALHLAASRYDSDVMKELLDSKADVHARAKSGKTPLHFAGEYDNIDVVKTCLSYGVDVK